MVHLQCMIPQFRTLMPPQQSYVVALIAEAWGILRRGEWR